MLSTSTRQQKPAASGKDRRGGCFLHEETQFMSKTCPGNCSWHKPLASPAAGHPIPTVKYHSLKPVGFLFKKPH